MELLPLDILEDLLLEVDLGSLRVNKRINSSINTILESNIFWMKKTSLLVNISLSTITSSNWKKVYYDLNKTPDPTDIHSIITDLIEDEVSEEYVIPYPDLVKVWVEYKSPSFLECLCESKNPDVIGILIQDRIIKRTNITPDHCLFLACGRNRLEVVRLLLQDPRITPCHRHIGIACDRNNPEVLRLLLEDGRYNIYEVLDDCISTIASYGHLEVLRLLVQDYGIDPSHDDNTCIRVGSCTHNPEFVRFLLQDPRVDPTAYDSACIRLYPEQYNSEVVRLLLEDGRADPSADNNQPLIMACILGYSDIVQLLLRDPRVTPSYKHLKIAIENNHVNIARLLLQDSRVDTGMIKNNVYWNVKSREMQELLLAMTTDYKESIALRR